MTIGDKIVASDIDVIVRGWDFKPGMVQARLVRAVDGREVVQLRLDLGLLQMETVGRPDGEVLYYLQSRGLDESAARRMFVTGFFQEIIDRVKVQSVREILEGYIEAELEEMR